jgi:ABC-type Fe3+ transport system permease subunit
MVTLSAVVFLASPKTYLASIFIFDSGSFGELGVACATSLKLIIIVGLCLIMIETSSKWAGLSVVKKQD